MYDLLDIFFPLFHTALIGFSVTGWIWKKTRCVHLAVMSLTCFSWLGLGFFYGFGYCPCTDWHWQVKRALGETGLPASYVKYYLDGLTGLDWDSSQVDLSVAVVGLAALGASIRLNWRDWRRSSHMEV
jgi:hypothetical protein